MSAFEPSEHTYGAAQAKNYQAEAGKEAKLSAGLDKASKAVAATGVAASVVAPPWSLIVTAAAAATALGIKVASAISGRNARALSGDEAAIAPFIKRANKMKPAKRKNVAERLLAALQRHTKKKGRGRPWKVRDNVLKMKLGALYAVEQHHKQKPNVKLDPDGPTPAEIAARPDGYFGMPSWALIGGGVLAVAALGTAAVGMRASRANPGRRGRL